MKHFNHTNIDDITYIPTKNIAISKPIIAAIKNAGGTLAKKGRPNIDPQSQTTSKMHRMKHFKNFFEDTYPPVILAKMEDSSLYRIIDGRHRVASSIINNMSFVPAIIQK